MNYWWTSDYHLENESVIDYYQRPFKSAKEMNETIITRHNEKVKAEDIVYFLGDFIIKEGDKRGEDKNLFFENQLNGTFIFIHGNHDKRKRLKTLVQKMYITYNSKEICMTHVPNNADPNVSLNFCGHVHSKYKVKRLGDKSLIINFSVDVWNYYPVSFREVHACVLEFLNQEKIENLKNERI